MKNARGLSRLVLLAGAVSSMAQAASTYLNGINIDGVTNQKFERATVRLDEKGNVLIDAPGYSVKAVENAPPPRGAGRAAEPSEAPVRMTKRYWLVTEQTVPGMTEFDIDL